MIASPPSSAARERKLLYEARARLVKYAHQLLGHYRRRHDLVDFDLEDLVQEGWAAAAHRLQQLMSGDDPAPDEDLVLQITCYGGLRIKSRLVNAVQRADRRRLNDAEAGYLPGAGVEVRSPERACEANDLIERVADGLTDRDRVIFRGAVLMGTFKAADVAAATGCTRKRAYLVAGRAKTIFSLLRE